MIDLDEFRRFREQPRSAHRQPVIDAFSDHQEQVGLAKCRVHRIIEGRIGIPHYQRMARRRRCRAPW